MLSSLPVSLPPANDVPEVDQSWARAPDPHFTLRKLLKPFAVALTIGLVLDGLDARLIQTLDDALNASGEQRQALNAQAAGLVAEYSRFVEGDPLIAVIDTNGFVSTSIRAEARRALADLARQL